EDKIFDKDTLTKTLSSEPQKDRLEKYSMSTMFQNNYDEDKIEMRQMLDVEQIHTDDKTVIEVKNLDGFIDLSPCIGIFLEANYFNSYYMVKKIRNLIPNYHDKKQESPRRDEYIDFINNKNRKSLNDLILFYRYLQTGKERYIEQAQRNFVNDKVIQQMNKRLSKELSRNEKIQQPCS
ncbi:AAA family ATPase, partial [Mesomycoplasma ovipneumoniae]